MFLGRCVLPGDQLWTDEDRDKVLAVLDDKAGRCNGCGLHESDVSHPDGRALRPPKYEPDTYKCHVCADSEQLYASVPSDQRQGVTIRLLRFVPETHRPIKR